MQRDGIIDFRADARLRQKSTQGISIGDADDVLVVDMPHAWHRLRQSDCPREPGPIKGRIVESGVPPARGAPRIEMRQFYVQNGGLNLIESEVAADERVMILRLAAVNAQNREPLGQR